MNSHNHNPNLNFDSYLIQTTNKSLYQKIISYLKNIKKFYENYEDNIGIGETNIDDYPEEYTENGIVFFAISGQQMFFENPERNSDMLNYFLLEIGELIENEIINLTFEEQKDLYKSLLNDAEKYIEKIKEYDEEIGSLINLFEELIKNSEDINSELIKKLETFLNKTENFKFELKQIKNENNLVTPKVESYILFILEEHYGEIFESIYEDLEKIKTSKISEEVMEKISEQYYQINQNDENNQKSIYFLEDKLLKIRKTLMKLINNLTYEKMSKKNYPYLKIKNEFLKNFTENALKKYEAMNKNGKDKLIRSIELNALNQWKKYLDGIFIFYKDKAQYYVEKIDELLLMKKYTFMETGELEKVFLEEIEKIEKKLEVYNGNHEEILESVLLYIEISFKKILEIISENVNESFLRKE